MLRIVRAFINNHPDIIITSTAKADGIQGIRLTLLVHSNEMAKVIGRKGANILALKFLMEEIGFVRNGEKIYVSLEEPIATRDGESRDLLKQWDGEENLKFVHWLIGLFGEEQLPGVSELGTHVTYTVSGRWLNVSPHVREAINTVVGLTCYACGRTGSVQFE